MTLYPKKLLIISAPSGAGKTTLVREVMHQFDIFEFSISATTRDPRGHEVPGKDYHFISAESFNAYIQADKFVEWEEVYPGRYYGTLHTEVERIMAAGKYPIFDVDVEGGLRIKEKFGEQALAIFISPPSIEELRNRLTKRATDSLFEIERRLAKSTRELGYADRFDHIIVNDLLDKAIVELIDLIQDTFLLKRDL